MKKTVVTILLVLPFVLMFIISFMARIMSEYQFIYVDSVCFINSEQVCMSEFIKLGLNETYDLDAKVYPELASNKNIRFSSLNENIVSINQEGLVTALDYGTTKVSVKTEDGGYRAELLIKVSDDNVSSINIIEEVIEINEKDTHVLNVIINPYTALNKKVNWTSSDTNIATVDANGKISAKKRGEVTISVVTEDGNFVDTCLVKVLGFNKPFDVIENKDGTEIYTIDSGYYDLNNLIVIYDEEMVNINDITYEIMQTPPVDSTKAKIEKNYLTIKENIIVRIVIKLEGIEYKPTIFVKYTR